MCSEKATPSLLIIPEHELEITASRAGGPGGQHVNKTNSRITIRWNIKTTTLLTAEQKERILQKLSGQLTADGEIIINCSTSRSQLENKKIAIKQLTNLIMNALRVPKKRLKTRTPQTIVEARLHAKSHRSSIKKMRNKKLYDE